MSKFISGNLNGIDLEKYHKILLSIGGGDLAGEYKDMLQKSQQYDSVSDFIKDDLEILSQDDEEQANEIKQALKVDVKEV